MADLLNSALSTATSAAAMAETDLLDQRPGRSQERLPQILPHLWRKVMSMAAWTVADRAALTALVKANLTATLASGSVSMVLITVLDDDGADTPRQYRWDGSSTTPADANTLASDEGGAGRWIAIRGDLAASGQGLNPAAVTVHAGIFTNLAGYTYDNGTGGQGATLTAGGVGAFATHDAVAAALNNLYLVAAQGGGASHLQNGVYQLTTVGDGSTAAVLTRVTSTDEGDELTPGIRIHVDQGTTYGGYDYKLWSDGPITLGTTALEFRRAARDEAAVREALAEATATIDINQQALQAGGLVLEDGSELTIATGSITPTLAYHTVDTEGDAATDDLDTIVVTNIPDTGFLLLKAEAASRVVSLKHGVDNIVTVDGLDIEIGNAVTDRVLLQRNGANFEVVAVGLMSGTGTSGFMSAADYALLRAHASRHQHGGADEVATATPGANVIPKAGAGGTLAAGFIPQATESAVGGGEIATQGETDTGTDDTRIVTPKKLKELTDPKSLDWVIDEDNMVSDSDTHVPTQQSVKAYVASQLTSELNYVGGYDANTNTPDLDTAPSGVSKGDVYTVTADGAFFTVDVVIGDMLIAEQDNANAEAHWTVVSKQLDAASETSQGIIELATQVEADAGADDARAVTPAKMAAFGGDFASSPTVAGAAIIKEGDARLTDARTPTGAAGGELAGTYPNPTVAALAITDGHVAAANKDGVAGTASMRTLGSGAQQSCAGNDSRLSDDRDPTAHASEHTDGTDDIQDATAGQKGLATVAQITKLDGIETAADVTDKTNVRSSLAAMDAEEGLSAVRVARAVYDFGVDGGAQGTITLGATLPAGALPIRSGYDVVTQFTSGGAATVQVRYQHAGGPTYTDIKAATAYNHADYNAGTHAGAQTGYGGAGNAVQTGGQLEMVIAAADLTAGKIVVYVEYVLTEGP